MTFFFRRLSISCEIIAFSLVLYVTRKGSLRGASLRNSRFSPCLTMSRMCLPEVIHSKSSENFLCLPENYQPYLQMSLLHFLILFVYPLPGFLISVLELQFVSLLWFLLGGCFCWNSSREVLEFFWVVFLVSTKIGTVSLVISTVIWCDINLNHKALKVHQELLIMCKKE